MEARPLARGHIYKIPYDGERRDSSEFKKKRPYVICQSIPSGVSLAYVYMAPMAQDNGSKLYPFQQRYKHLKASKIHYENTKLVDVRLLKEYAGCLDEKALQEMEQCQVALYDLDDVTYTDIKSLKVGDLASSEIEVVIQYSKKDKVVSFSKQDFYKECIGFGNYLTEKEKIEFFLSTFTGLQFLRKKGKVLCQTMSWTSSI